MKQEIITSKVVMKDLSRIDLEDVKYQIKEIIETELLKRSYTCKIARIEVEYDRYGKLRFIVESEYFQTMPVIFKTLRIESFGSWLSKETIKDTDNFRFVVTIDLHNSYTHFGGGSNGCGLFNIRLFISENGRVTLDNFFS